MSTETNNIPCVGTFLSQYILINFNKIKHRLHFQDDGSRHGKVGNMDVYLERLPLSLVLSGKNKFAKTRVVYYKN